MAARKGESLTDKWREKIKTSMLINRLNSFALGESGVEMSSEQIRAAIALIGKTLPDLKATEHSAKEGTAVGGLIWNSPKAP